MDINQLGFWNVLNSFKSEITEFLAILTQAARPANEAPYTIDAPSGKDLIPRTLTFDRWKPADWKSFRESLVKIQTSMLRRDANASINDIFSGGGENKEIDPSRSVSIFRESFMSVIIGIKQELLVPSVSFGIILICSFIYPNRYIARPMVYGQTI